MSRDRDDDKDSYRRRDRSRSRDRRRRYKDEHDDRDRPRHRGRSSEDNDDYRRRRDDNDDYPRRDRDIRRQTVPVVFLEKVPERVTQSEITRELSKYSEKIRDIRVFKRGDRNEPYKSAVVEFYEREHAARWLNENKDSFMLLGERVSAEGSLDPPEPKGDWVCSQCRKLNFSRRTQCVSCKYPRRESERDSTHDDQWDRRAPPANVLIVRGLDPETQELNVVNAVALLAPELRMKDVRVIREKGCNLSRGFAFIELNNVEEAKDLLETLTSKRDPFIVSGKRVIVDYARPSNTYNNSKTPTNSVATAAIAQAQWSHVGTNNAALGPTQSTVYQASQQGAEATATIATTATATTQDVSADNELSSSYSYDETSGFYYDSKTGLYYDPKTQYHYNSQTGQYCYYDPAQLKYVPVDSEGNPLNEADPTKTGGLKMDGNSLVSASSISAKKIAKNMERWAKSVNAAKSAQKQQVNMLTQQSKPLAKPSTSKSIPSVGIAVGNTVPQVEKPVPRNDISVTPLPRNTLPRHTLPSGADTNPTHTDWDQLACLLCKRKFPSKDVLVKHQQFSDLHKQNLLKWKNPQQTAASTSDQTRYRDRAQERRVLVGSSAIVPEWKKKIDQEMAQPPIPYEQPTIHGLKEDNIGNKMLTAMGWSDGQGLGRSNQGIVEPIKAEIRQSAAGLGSKGSAYGYGVGDDYKSNVMAMTQARYKETL
ncbi:RNA-binding protein 5-A-like isoform X2 [Halichondria panicea]|uniref:RNA-binding protein 5-A-like isoform X2 n=1 Tax=Halichondria panicea TaxID=6063 RepID=UPI00312BAD65